MKTWLFGIAHNVWLEELKKRPQEEELHESPSPHADIEERLDLRQAFSQLKSVEREVLLLADVVGMSSQEAAGLLGTTEEAFRVRLHRARKRLKERYGNE